eukprot:TRINITY_DN65011_c0_g1_i1.p1 TRINITY_DN65011_c0_g1~~TRINITY_DN65011_c0_g1_i1.p1  ORF type:complete len:625 (+),score=144.63 TRINITY_DN65011_c0_g1_i1:53-1927(+)
MRALAVGEMLRSRCLRLPARSTEWLSALSAGARCCSSSSSSSGIGAAFSSYAEPHPADVLFGDASASGPRPYGPGRNDAPLPKHTRVLNSLRREQVIRGVVVDRLDEDGNGVVNLFVRRDKQAYQFTFERALPGEKLHLVVTSVKRDRYNKKVPSRYQLGIEERGGASPDEVTPECPHFREGCGGCALQNLAHDAQIREKARLLEQRLEEYGLRCGSLRDTVASPDAFGFHSRMEFQFFARGGLHLGLHPAGSPVPLAIARCRIQAAASQEAFQALLDAARADADARAFDPRTGQGFLVSAVFRAARRPDGREEVLVSLITTADAPEDCMRRLADAVSKRCPDVVGITWSPSGAEWRPGQRGVSGHAVLAGRPFLVQHVCGARLEAVPEGFMRPNILLAEAFYRTILELADVKASDTVWDAFCGQGPLTALLLPHCRRVVALDRSTPALAALRAGLSSSSSESERAEIRNIDLGNMEQLWSLVHGAPARSSTAPAGADAHRQHRSQALEAQEEDDDDEEEEEDDADDEDPQMMPLTHADKSHTSLVPDVVIADPGRKGTPKAFRSMLYRIQARTVVMVGSGRPFLRDCALLVRRGYDLSTVVPFDSQPHAARLEVVAQLRRRSI